MATLNMEVQLSALSPPPLLPIVKSWATQLTMSEVVFVVDGAGGAHVPSQTALLLGIQPPGVAVFISMMRELELQTAPSPETAPLGVAEYVLQLALRRSLIAYFGATRPASYLLLPAAGHRERLL